MSTLKSYFTRSKRGNQSKEVESVAIRAPQAYKEPVKMVLDKPKKKVNKNSILFYLNPQPKSQVQEKQKQEEKVKEEEEEEHVVCKIKHTTPFSLVWENILNEYNDPLASLYVDEKYARKEDFTLVTGSPLRSIKRKLVDKYEEDKESDDETVRNVRIRRRIPFAMPVFEDFYDDDSEDLPRPLKVKVTAMQTSKAVMNIANQFLTSPEITL